MSNVVKFPGLAKLDIPVKDILKDAKKEDLDEVVVIGYTKSGDEYFSSSTADGADVLWLLERCKHLLVTSQERD